MSGYGVTGSGPTQTYCDRVHPASDPGKATNAHVGQINVEAQKSHSSNVRNDLSEEVP